MEIQYIENMTETNERELTTEYEPIINPLTKIPAQNYIHA